MKATFGIGLHNSILNRNTTTTTTTKGFAMSFEVTRFTRNLDATGLFGSDEATPQFTVEHVTVIDGKEYTSPLTVRLVTDGVKGTRFYDSGDCLVTCTDKNRYLTLYDETLALIGEPQKLA